VAWGDLPNLTLREGGSDAACKRDHDEDKTRETVSQSARKHF
jgi:hypothetical protein